MSKFIIIKPNSNSCDSETKRRHPLNEIQKVANMSILPKNKVISGRFEFCLKGIDTSNEKTNIVEIQQEENNFDQYFNKIYMKKDIVNSGFNDISIKNEAANRERMEREEEVSEVNLNIQNMNRAKEFMENQPEESQVRLNLDLEKRFNPLENEYFPSILFKDFFFKDDGENFLDEIELQENMFDFDSQAYMQFNNNEIYMFASEILDEKNNINLIGNGTNTDNGKNKENDEKIKEDNSNIEEIKKEKNDNNGNPNSPSNIFNNPLKHPRKAYSKKYKKRKKREKYSFDDDKCDGVDVSKVLEEIINKVSDHITNYRNVIVKMPCENFPKQFLFFTPSEMMKDYQVIRLAKKTDENLTNKQERKRKFKPDDIRKKIKAKFHKRIKNVLNSKLKDAGSSRFFDFLPQTFISNISIDKNKAALEKTYLDILKDDFSHYVPSSAREGIDCKKYINNLTTVQYLVMNEKISSKSGFDIIKNMKYADIINEYIYSKEFEKDFYSVFKATNNDSEYAIEYLNKAKTYVDFFRKTPSPNFTKKKNNMI